MNKAFTTFLQDTYPYIYTNWPDVISTQKEALEKGLNCITLVHLLIQNLFNTTLPTYLRCIELFYDNPYFTKVNSLSDLEMGDILFVGTKGEEEKINIFIPEYDSKGKLLNESVFPHMHIAMYTGENDKNSDPLFIHANWMDKKVSIWPLRQFQEYSRYEQVYTIKRLA